jgi:hypothetical protein
MSQQVDGDSGGAVPEAADTTAALNSAGAAAAAFNGFAARVEAIAAQLDTKAAEITKQIAADRAAALVAITSERIAAVDAIKRERREYTPRPQRDEDSAAALISPSGTFVP